MARVNTKFLLIIFIVVSLIGGASGVFYLLRVKADSGRHIRLGDAFMEQAAYRKAHTSYGRAVNKDPGNAEYLARFRDSLLAITPDNREEARKFYLEYHGILDRAITYQGHDPQTYIDRINEIHFAARHGTSTSLWWEQMEEVAQRMWDKYASGAEPRRIEARLYRGLSRFRRARLLEPVELEEAEADLEAFLEVFPKSDLGWASLLEAHLVLADMAKSSDDPSGYLQRSAAATSTLARAEAAGADGPCLASARLTYMAIRLREGLADPSSEQAVTAAQLDLAAREYVDAVEAVMDEDDMFLAQALNLFVVYQTLGGTSTIELADGTSIVGIILPTLDSTLLIARRDGTGVTEIDAADVVSQSVSPRDRLIDVAETFLERNPDRHWHRDRLAQLLLVRRELEAADEHAEVVLNATMGTVGFLTQFIDQLHRSAAGRLFDSCYVRWEFASDEDRVAAVEAAEKAMARVEPLVIDPARNSMFRRIVGRLALMKGDYEKAAVEFGELARTNPTRDGLLTAAMCFERIGNVGSAYSTMARLLENDRRNTRYLYESARLAGRIGLTEDAMAYLDDLFAIDPEHELGQSLMIRMRMQAGGTDQPFNELEEALREADRAIEAGDPATARATLLGALDEAPRDIQILNRLYIAAAASGDREEQLQWVDRMLELNPANDSLQRLRASLTNADDPLEGIRQYVAQLNLPESEAAVKLTRNFASLAAGQRATANRFESLGRGEDAAAATSLADLASAAAEEAAQRAETLAPNHPRLIEYRFRNALRDDRLVDAEEIIAAATRENADGAGGELFKGQLALARGDSASAARHLAAASAALPYSSYVNRLLGSAYVQTGDFAKAQDAYEDAYQNNPNDAQTATQYIRLLMQVGDEPRALSVARTTHRLMPNSILLREAWLSLEDRIGDRPFVLLKRRTLYAEDPKDAANAESLARFLVKTRPSEALLLDDAGNPRYAHSPWVRMSESDRNEIIESERAAWGKEADAILATLQTDFPGIQTTLLRSSLLRERGDIDGGAAVLLEALDGDLEREDALRVRLALSSYQRSVGRVDRAIATLREARALQDPAVREADLALGMLYAQAGAFDNALASLREVAAVNNDPSVERSIAFCMVKLEMYDEAQRRIEAAIDVGRNGYEEQMLLALIADARGDLAERSNESGASHFATAEQALTEASRLMPSRPEPYVERAQMQLRAFNREIATATPVEAERMRTQSSRLREALSELEQADSVKFGDPKTSLVRVKIFQAQRDTEGAIGELTRLVERSPNDVGARDMLVRLHYANEDEQAALRVLDEGIRRNDTLQDWFVLRGDLLTDLASRGEASERQERVDANRRGAIEAYERAFQISSSHMSATKLTNAYFAVTPPQYDKAVSVLASLMAESPEDGVFGSLYARALHATGDEVQAMEVLRAAFGHARAAEDSRAVTTWYVALEEIFEDRAADAEAFCRDAANQDLAAVDLQWLARYWLSNEAGSIARVIDLQQQAISLNAGQDTLLEVALSNDLAQYLLLAGRLDEATEAFERVIELDPDLKAARNNYAYLLAEVLGRPNDALEHAEAAVDLLSPYDPPSDWASFLDTRGWVRYLAGDITGAEEDLRESTENLETDGNTFHLATLLHSKGSYEAASYWVNRAAELAANLPQESQKLRDITALADDIRTRRSQQ